MITAKKLSLFIISLAALCGYSLGYISEYTDIGALTGLTGVIKPYSFLLVIMAVIIAYTPHQLWKRSILGTMFAITLIITITDYNVPDFAKNLPALMASILGFVTMIALPKMQLWKKVVIGLVVGLLLGMDLKLYEVPHYSEYIKLVGTKFIDLIMMIVAPLIFFSLISGINNMGDSSALERVGFKAVGIYLLSAMFAVLLGLVMALIFEPGKGMDIHQLSSAASPTKKASMEFSCAPKNVEVTDQGKGISIEAGSEAIKLDCAAIEKASGYPFPPLVKVFADFIPHNGLGALVGADGKPSMIQTVFFAIFVGIALNMMGDQGKRLVEISHSGAQLMFKIIGYIIKLSPFAVFGFMAWVTANLGVDALVQLFQLVLTTIASMGIHLIILALMMIFIGKLNPIPFFKKSFEYQALAFSTSSSKATLTTAMKIGEERMGISKSSISFVLPLGAAINMDGTAIYLGICAVFFAQITGVTLDFHHYIIIIFAATIASMGAAGYPGGSIVVMYMVLQTIGVSDAYIGILLGVDRVLDMFRTTINVTSDVALTAIIDASEGTLDKKTYYASMEELDKKLKIA